MLAGKLICNGWTVSAIGRSSPCDYRSIILDGSKCLSSGVDSYYTRTYLIGYITAITSLKCWTPGCNRPVRINCSKSWSVRPFLVSSSRGCSVYECGFCLKVSPIFLLRLRRDLDQYRFEELALHRHATSFSQFATFSAHGYMRLPWGSVAIYWVSCTAEMTRILRDQWLSMAIGKASVVTFVWLEAFVCWGGR